MEYKHFEIGYFTSFDLDLDSMTMILEPDVAMVKAKFLNLVVQKLQSEQRDRQTA